MSVSQSTMTAIRAAIPDGRAAIELIALLSQTFDVTSPVQSVAEAAAAAVAAGGGVIRLGKGNFEASALPIRTGIYYQGLGGGLTKITNNADSDLFIASTAAALRGGGIVGIELDGGGTDTYDCIEMNLVDKVDAFLVDDSYIHGFRRGYNGPKNAASFGFDRSTSFFRTEIADCVVGVFGEEHPWAHTCWFHDCDTGITGRMVDGMIAYCRFGNCTLGADSMNGANIGKNIVWDTCEFYDNATGLIARERAQVVGCKFTHTSEDEDNAIGMLVAGPRVHVNGCRFGFGAHNEAPTHDFAKGAIRVGLSGGGSPNFLVVNGCSFGCGDGPGIIVPLASESGVSPKYCQITGNSFVLAGQRALDVASDNSIAWSGFSNNNIVHISGTISSGGMVHWRNGGSGGGGVLTGNSFYRAGGTAAEGISGIAIGAVIANNYFDPTVATPVTATTTGALIPGSERLLSTNVTPVANVGGGEDDLQTYTIPGGTLAVDGDLIRFEVYGRLIANGENKRIRLKFGGTTIFDTSALAVASDRPYKIEGVIQRTGATTQVCNALFSSQLAVAAAAGNVAASETLSGDVVLKVTGEVTGTTNDGIFSDSLRVWKDRVQI